MEIYIKFILIGLAIAMPVGAITVEMTKQGRETDFFMAGQWVWEA